MTTLRVLVVRLLEVFVRGRRERRLAEEIDAHLDLLAEDHLRRGLSQDAARAAARRAFGGVDQVKAEHRDQRGFSIIDALKLDLRFAARLLAKDRAFTFVAALALGLGIGANNTFFTLMSSICLRGLPIPQAERVLFMATRDRDDSPGALSYADLMQARAALRSVSGVGAYGGAEMTVAEEGSAPDRVPGSYISAGAFHLLGRPPVLGREFLPEDDRSGAAAVTMVSHALWHSRYGADPSIVGRTILVDGVSAIVVGVVAGDFPFPNNASLWQPLARMPGLDTAQREVRMLGAFGRLADDAGMGPARAELDALAQRLAIEQPATHRGVRFTAVPINEQFTGNITDRVWLAFITAGVLVLLIACANVANLQLMRSATRMREMAMRTAIGATAGRLVRQLLVEHLLLACLGGLVGLGVSQAGVGLVSRMVPAGTLPPWMAPVMDARVLVTLAIVCLVSPLIFGLVPAIHAARIPVSVLLKDGSRIDGGARARRWTTVFLVAEFALTFVLLASVALNLQQFRALQRAETLTDTDAVLTMRVALPAAKYDTDADRRDVYDRLIEQVAAIKLVSSASIAGALPYGGGVPRAVTIEGRPAVPGEPQRPVLTLPVGAGYFATLQIAVRRGRPLTAIDSRPGSAGVVVNEPFVTKFLQGVEPLGAHVLLAPADPKGAAAVATVVGVLPDVRQRPGRDPEPVVYVPAALAPPATAALMVRTAADAGAITQAIRERVHGVDPTIALYRVMRLDQAMREATWNGRVSSLLINGIAGISLVLALVGLYAVTAHAVAQRTQEIGVRMTLGARPGHVRWLVLRRALGQLALGLTVGVALTIASERLLIGSASQVWLAHPGVLLQVTTLLVLVSVVACLAPASRASRLDPVSALRGE